MRRIVSLALFVVCFSALPGRHHDLHAQQPGLTVMKLYTAADGLAYFEKVDVPLDQRIKLGGMRASRSKPTAADAQLTFHNAPRRQYIITLTGKCEVTASGGQKMTFDKDHILLVEDVTGKGHTTRFIGPEDWLRVFLEVDEPAPPAR